MYSAQNWIVFAVPRESGIGTTSDAAQCPLSEARRIKWGPFMTLNRHKPENFAAMQSALVVQ
jgi:hypothetical protein